MDKTVKFKAPGDPKSQLTAQDKTIASLKALIVDLNEQIAILASRIVKMSEDTQKAVEKKNRVSALATIKSRKLSERTLAQRTETLSQIEEVYSKIEQAADQVAIVRVMEASTNVLQSLHKEVGGVEKLENVMEGLREQVNKVDEINDIIETAGHEGQIFHEDAVKEELEEMLQQANAQEERVEAKRTQQRLADIDSKAEEIILQGTDSEDKSGSTALTSGRDEDHLVNEGLNALKRLSLDAKLPASTNQTHPVEQDTRPIPLPG